MLFIWFPLLRSTLSKTPQNGNSRNFDIYQSGQRRAESGERGATGKTVIRYTLFVIRLRSPDFQEMKRGAGSLSLPIAQSCF